MNEQATEQPRIYIDKEHHAALKVLCEATRRNLGAQVELLIDEELERQQNPTPDGADGNDKTA